MLFTLSNSVTASSIHNDTIYLFSERPYQLKAHTQLPGGIKAENLSASIDMIKASISDVPVTAKRVNKITNSNLNTDDTSLLPGIAAIITGEPLVVVSLKNKKRAFSLSTTEQVIRKMHRNSISRVSIPSIKLTIHL